MSKTYCIKLDDERAKKLEEMADGMPIGTYLRSLIEGLVHTEEENPDPVEYKRLADSIYASILSDEIENGKEFCLRDISTFSNICVASAKQGKVSVETVRARIGKVWNAKVAHGKYPGVERAKTDNGALKFDCGAAVYRKVV